MPMGKPITILLLSGFLTVTVSCGDTPVPGMQALDVPSPADIPRELDNQNDDLPPRDGSFLDAPLDTLLDGALDTVGTDPSGDAAGGPRIALEPDALDFGFVGKGISTPRSLTIRNDGDFNLNISTVTLTQDSNGEFTVDASTALAGPILGGTSVVIVVTVKNLGADLGDISGRMRIQSNDPMNPLLDVVLTGSRAGEPVCDVKISPLKTSLGDVVAGHLVQRPLSIVNIGGAAFVIQELEAFGCGGAVGAPDCGQSFGPSDSWKIQLNDQTSPLVYPGSTVTAKVSFQAPASVTGKAEGVFGRFSMTYSCPYGAVNPRTLFWTADCPPSESCRPNLEANVTPAAIQVEPARIVFPETTVGCPASPFEVSLKNAGDATLRISTIEVDPSCAGLASFDLPGLPTLPIDLVSKSAINVKVAFLPTSTGEKECNLRIGLSLPAQDVILVPIIGPAVAAGHVVDRFAQVGRKTDILFVSDTSASMHDGIQRLVDSIPTLTAAFIDSGTDPRLGVIGLGMEKACPTVADLMGTPRILDAQSIDSLKDTVDGMLADTKCVPATGKSGLEVMRLALTTPRIDDLGTSCSTDDTCTSPYRCVDKGCGGSNRGFLRNDASLEVLVISDQDDQSPSTVSAYVSFLESIKGTGGEALVRVHAIAGDAVGGCNNAYDSAIAGTRYIQAANATGGTFASICQADYADVLTHIGNSPYTPRTAFPLSGNPTSNSVSITVDGTPCVTGWTLDAITRVVNFDLDGSCFPAPGVPVVASYVEACQ